MSIDLAANPFFLSESQIQWVQDSLQKLTVEQKIGQLFCVMGGDYSIETLQKMTAEKGVGAVLYRPAPSVEIRDSFAKLDEVASVPILKAANLEEGGSGGISDGTLFGWPMTVGATDDEEMVEKFAEVCAVEGKSVGINWTFSPVSDLDINPLNPITNVRSYGTDLDRVMRFTNRFASTVQKYGVAACAKHFPGDGVDFRDHHLHPTYNSLSAEEWYESYGKIYQNMIANGLLSVMVGHIVQPAVEMKKNPKLTFADCLPGSVSPELLNGVLREEFGFNGVITTDATIMGGFCMAMERKKAIPAAIMAGCDMLVFSTDFEEDYRYMLEAIENGALTPERLEEAVTRILALKAKMCLTEYELPKIHAKEWQRECADKAVTLVKDTQQIFPVTAEQYPKIRLILLGEDAMDGGSIVKYAAQYLEKEGFAVECYQPFEDELHGTGDLSKDCLTIYLANYQTRSNQTTVRIRWCDKHALDIPRFVNEEKSIFVSLSNPYHLQDIPRVRTYINGYSATASILEAVLEKILGKSTFKGKSPVDAFCGLMDTRL